MWRVWVRFLNCLCEPGKIRGRAGTVSEDEALYQYELVCRLAAALQRVERSHVREFFAWCLAATVVAVNIVAHLLA